MKIHRRICVVQCTKPEILKDVEMAAARSKALCCKVADTVAVVERKSFERIVKELTRFGHKPMVIQP